MPAPDPFLPAPEGVVAPALTGSPDGAPSRRVAPEPSGGSCWGVVLLVLGVFAAVALIVCWSDVRAGLARAWAWVRARFRRSPKP